MKHTAAPFTTPKYVMAKPAGPLCNLDCKYCYYTEKTALLGKSAKMMHMSDELLEEYIRQYIAIQPGAVLFTWHGGEPLLRSRDFYEKVLTLQRKYANGKQIDNSIQTNGTLITDDWAKFLVDNHFLVGVSIDGPQDLHDTYRLSRSGQSSWSQVMQGIEILNKHKVEWNAMAVVTHDTSQRPLDFYNFFRAIDCNYIQFTPVVERLKAHADGRHLASPIDQEGVQMAPYSVTPKGWGTFLCAVFDEWLKHDLGQRFVQIFESTLAGWVGVPPGLCTMAPVCGHAAVMECNGDVYSCDHFVFPEFKLGNIADVPLSEMFKSPRQVAFGANKAKRLTAACKRCQWLSLCHGECPRNRFAYSVDGEPGHNYLCEGYKMFFEHSANFMREEKRFILANQ